MRPRQSGEYCGSNDTRKGQDRSRGYDRREFEGHDHRGSDYGRGGYARCGLRQNIHYDSCSYDGSDRRGSHFNDRRGSEYDRRGSNHSKQNSDSGSDYDGRSYSFERRGHGVESDKSGSEYDRRGSEHDRDYDRRGSDYDRRGSDYDRRGSDYDRRQQGMFEAKQQPSTSSFEKEKHLHLQEREEMDKKEQQNSKPEGVEDRSSARLSKVPEEARYKGNEPVNDRWANLDDYDEDRRYSGTSSFSGPGRYPYVKRNSAPLFGRASHSSYGRSNSDVGRGGYSQYGRGPSSQWDGIDWSKPAPRNDRLER